MSIFANSEDPDEMQHNAAFIRVYTACKDKLIFRQKDSIFFENYNLTPLDMYNGLSKSYCIEPEGRIH